MTQSENVELENSVLSDVLNGFINSDEAAIKLDENGIEVEDELYDKLRDAEKSYNDKSRGLQVGDTIMVRGRFGIPDFQANFRGYTPEGKVVVTYDRGKQMVISKDEFYMEMQNISEEVVDIIESTPEQVTKTSNLNLLINDNWYTLNPEKVLGMPYESSGRFGKVTKYKGTIEDVKKIDADENFIGADKSLNNPLASVTNNVNISAELERVSVQNNVIDAIEKSKSEIADLKKSKKRKVVVAVEQEETELSESKTFEEVYEETKGNITLEELEAYVWYKSSIGKPLSKYYVKLFKPSLFSADEDLTETYVYTVEQERINQFINNGILFYYNKILIPKVEYLQGDMYEKKIALDREKEYIETTYGEEAFLKQQQVLKEGFDVVYQRRLTIGGEKALVLLPISEFAKNFRVESIEMLQNENDTRFQLKMSKKGANYGEPDIINSLGYIKWNDKKTYESITLVDAFKYWMLKTRPALKEPINHLDIVKVYMDGGRASVTAKNDSKKEVEKAKAQAERLKSSTKKEGERLFQEFLETQLLPSDKIKLETTWNIDNNNYLPPNFNSIPIGFRMAKTVFGNFEEIRPEKRDAVAFALNNGTAIISYDVGVGKTPSAIFSISAFMDAGYCKRPLIVVPNQVYKQFINEIKQFAPHLKVNEAYNLGEDYISNFKDEDGAIKSPEKGTVTIMTYEGFEMVGFKEETREEIIGGLYEILNQGNDAKASAKKEASFEEKLQKIMGRGVKGTLYNIEDFGFDFMCYDEAHKMKKVFTSVKGTMKEEGGEQKRAKNPYLISSGVPSTIALKGFMVNHYILINNNFKNVILLTATPFTNSPLEVFSMLAMVGYEQLKKDKLNNLKDFFDTFVLSTNELVINSRLKPQYKNVILGFNNLIPLQLLIRRFILYKTGDEVGVPRPKKYVLPYTKDIENGITINLSEEKKIETYISMTPSQSQMMANIIGYVEGTNALELPKVEDEEDEFIDVKDALQQGDGSEEGEYSELEDADAQEIDEEALDEQEKIGVRTIKGLNYSRNLALSPYLYPYSGLIDPTAKEYIETSPKLSYVMDCVKSVRDYHLAKGEPISGQVIYMDRGIQYFKLLKQYLVEYVGYADHEIGIIQSGLPKTGVKSKEYIKNLFNGEIYNEKTKEYEKVSDDQRIKIVIGSSTIKEGMNLQKYGTVLYNCFVDWNPTDMQQLEGRIYRQGNKFKNVRIVIPLVVDSADIFLFQKLQEKTSRLNTIWSTDGRSNTMKTDELNPEELKYALIRDPNVILQLRLLEMEAKLKSEKMGFERQMEIGRNIIQSASEMTNYYPKIAEEIVGYRKFTESGDLIADANKLVQLSNDAEKTNTDENGLHVVESGWKAKYDRGDLFEKFAKNVAKDRLKVGDKVKRKVDSWVEDYFRDVAEVNTNDKDEITTIVTTYGGWKRETLYPKDVEKVPDISPYISPLEKSFRKPYTFTAFAVASRDMKKFKNDFIDPYKIPFSVENPQESMNNFIADVKQKIQMIDDDLQSLTTPEAKNILFTQIIEEKEAQKISYKDIEGAVQDFSKLNYLLSEMKVPNVAVAPTPKVEEVVIPEPIQEVVVEKEQIEEKPVPQSKEQIEKVIKSLNLALKYASDEANKKAISNQIKSLQIALKYS